MRASRVRGVSWGGFASMWVVATMGVAAELPRAPSDGAARTALVAPAPRSTGPAAKARTEPAFRSQYVLATGRVAPRRRVAGLLRLQLHGEFQVRYSRLTDLPLAPYTGAPSSDALGQTSRLYQWLRVTPRASIGEDFELVTQIDVPRGLMLGHENQHVTSAREPLDRRQPFQAAPRWAYIEWGTPSALVRAGQQPWHWGLGLVANDGDHASPFGDPVRGTIVDRLLVSAKPGGPDSSITVALAGDAVFQDATTSLPDGDHATQGVFTVSGEDDAGNGLGAFASYRRQDHTRHAGFGAWFPEDARLLTLDAAGRASAPMAGNRGWIFGTFEAAYQTGSARRPRAEAPTLERDQIRAFGSVVKGGAVLTRGKGRRRWGAVVASLEWGWASGDDRPEDGESRRFTMDPNHRVGLLLFDEALRWKSARAVDELGNPAASFARAPAGQLLPTDGGVSGASYLSPMLVFRPVRPLDLKVAAVLAQTTADLVDPVRRARTGARAGYDGGPSSSRDLGLELDAGVEYRLRLDLGMVLELGAQGGVLFPGRAFADAGGNALGTQAIGVGRVGLQY